MVFCLEKHLKLLSEEIPISSDVHSFGLRENWTVRASLLGAFDLPKRWESGPRAGGVRGASPPQAAGAQTALRGLRPADSSRVPGSQATARRPRLML